MGREVKINVGKYYGPAPNKKTGEPATLQPGTTVKNLTFQESYKAEKSLYPDKLNHKFLENGEPVVFNGANMLDKLVAQIAPGDVVNITYVGNEPCPFGPRKGRPTHVYRLFYSDDVPATAAPEAEAPADEEDAF